jgi:hypothetical protein
VKGGGLNFPPVHLTFFRGRKKVYCFFLDLDNTVIIVCVLVFIFFVLNPCGGIFLYEFGVYIFMGFGKAFCDYKKIIVERNKQRLSELPMEEILWQKRK